MYVVHNYYYFYLQDIKVLLCLNKLLINQINCLIEIQLISLLIYTIIFFFKNNTFIRFNPHIYDIKNQEFI